MKLFFPRFMIWGYCVSILSLCNSCSDIRGAAHPYTYAPNTSHSTWKPKKIPSRIFDALPDIEALKSDMPLTMGEAIDIALLNNPNTKNTWALARAAAATYGESLQNFWIQANLNAYWEQTRTGEYTGSVREIIYETDYGYGLDLSYLIMDFGQTRATSRAALQALFNADYTHNQEIQDTVNSVLYNYYYYLYQKQLLVAAEDDVVNAQVSLDAVLEKLRNGVANIADKTQAETTLRGFQLTVVTQKQTVHDAYTNLITTLGLPANAELTFVDYPERITVMNYDDLDSLIIRAMENRPDILAAEANIKSKEQTLLAAQRSRYPTINTEFDITEKYGQQGLESGVLDYTWTFNLNMPLFQGFFIENSIKLARANLEASKASYEDTRLTVYQNVSNYRVNVLLSKESLEYADAYLSAAEEDFRLNLETYKVGTSTIVDLINAQTAVADARAKLATAQNSYFSSLSNLANAIGILEPSKLKEEGITK